MRRGGRRSGRQSPPWFELWRLVPQKRPRELIAEFRRLLFITGVVAFVYSMCLHRGNSCLSTTGFFPYPHVHSPAAYVVHGLPIPPLSILVLPRCKAKYIFRVHSIATIHSFLCYTRLFLTMSSFVAHTKCDPCVWIGF